MAELTQSQVRQLTEALEPVVGDDQQTKDMTEMLTTLLAVPDEQFVILAPGVLQAYEQSLNNPNDKIRLVQALNASGSTAEEVTASFMELNDIIDQTSLSNVKRDFLKEMLAAIINCVNDTEGIAKRIVQIPLELCHENAKVPQYAHQSDSGMDVYALEDVTIHPGETVLVPTGIKVALPPGFELQVRPKSGRALKTKLRVANTPGTIDQGYRDEIKVIIENVEPPVKDITVDEEGRVTSILYGSDYYIEKGDKFAQLVLMEVPKAAFYNVDSVNEIGENRNGGFGSTGLK